MTLGWGSTVLGLNLISKIHSYLQMGAAVPISPGSQEGRTATDHGESSLDPGPWSAS